MVTISFEYPVFLYFLFLVPFFILIYFLGISYGKRKSVLFANFEALERFSEIEMFSKNFLILYLNIIILCLLIFSVAGTNVTYKAKTSSFSYVLLIDNSWSMKASDMYPNRLEAAKESAKRFVDLLPGGVEVGVMAFSGDAEVMQELELSKIRTKTAIDSIDFGNVQGTNIYNAVRTANQLFENRRMRAMILISDGQLNVGEAPDIIKYATRRNIMINTIAAGTEEGGLTEFGTISKVDEDFLRSLSFNTDGKFFRASNLSSLDESFDYMLKETDKDVSVNVSFYLLFAALFLFSIDWILYNFRFRILP